MNSSLRLTLARLSCHRGSSNSSSMLHCLSKHKGVTCVPMAQATTRMSRTFSSKAPGSDPLDLLRMECTARSLCSEDGRHLPGTHWVLSLAIAHSDATKAPSLRTVGIAQISRHGIDFVLKRGSMTSDHLVSSEHRPVAVLHHHGRFLPGEVAEQWRAEGVCHPLRLDQSILDCIPKHTITSMIASSRVAAEESTGTTTNNPTGNGNDNDNSRVSLGRRVLPNKSHLTEIMQMTHGELANNEIPVEIMEHYMAAYRFRPHRMECMMGGPDSVMWDRWEWLLLEEGSMKSREDKTSGQTWPTLAWNEPKQLIPH